MAKHKRAVGYYIYCERFRCCYRGPYRTDELAAAVRAEMERNEQFDRCNLEIYDNERLDLEEDYNSKNPKKWTQEEIEELQNERYYGDD